MALFNAGCWIVTTKWVFRFVVVVAAVVVVAVFSRLVSVVVGAVAALRTAPYLPNIIDAVCKWRPLSQWSSRRIGPAIADTCDSICCFIFVFSYTTTPAVV